MSGTVVVCLFLYSWFPFLIQNKDKHSSKKVFLWYGSLWKLKTTSSDYIIRLKQFISDFTF